MARVVLPGYPHHITQRGNRRQDVFFNDEDYLYYLELLKHWCDKEKLEIWCYCLMTNHVHLIVTPRKSINLSRAMGETHRRYTRMIHFRENWRGYLWQGRFASFAMDKCYLLKAAAYVELNPVKAKMVQNPEDYRWSSVHAHLRGVDPLGIVDPGKLLEICGDWKEYLKYSTKEPDDEFIRHASTGRPLGSDAFIKRVEKRLNRDLQRKKPGPKVAENS